MNNTDKAFFPDKITEIISVFQLILCERSTVPAFENVSEVCLICERECIFFPEYKRLLSFFLIKYGKFCWKFPRNTYDVYVLNFSSLFENLFLCSKVYNRVASCQMRTRWHNFELLIFGSFCK